MDAIAEYDDIMSGIEITDGKLKISSTGMFDTMLQTFTDELSNCDKYDDVRQILFVTMCVQRKLSNSIILETIERFPELVSTFIIKTELTNSFESLNFKKSSEIAEFLEMLKPDAKVYLLHLYLIFNKNTSLDVVKRLYIEEFDSNELIFANEDQYTPSNMLEIYVMGCTIHSYLFTICNNEVFRFLMNPSRVGDISRIFYVTIENADPEIISDLICDGNMKNKIICEEQGWTLFHAFIWNSTWTGSEQSQSEKRVECYKELITSENILIKDTENRTPKELYEEIFSEFERDIRIIEMLS